MLSCVHILCRVHFVIAFICLWFVSLKVGDVAGQSIGTIVNQIFSKLALFCIYFRVWFNMRWVNDRCIKSGFDGMIKKNTVEHWAGVWFQAERDIADSK